MSDIIRQPIEHRIEKQFLEQFSKSYTGLKCVSKNRKTLQRACY